MFFIVRYIKLPFSGRFRIMQTLPQSSPILGSSPSPESSAAVFEVASFTKSCKDKKEQEIRNAGPGFCWQNRSKNNECEEMSARPSLLYVALISKLFILPSNFITIGKHPSDILPYVFLKTYPCPLVADTLISRFYKLKFIIHPSRRQPGYKEYIS